MPQSRFLSDAHMMQRQASACIPPTHLGGQCLKGKFQLQSFFLYCRFGW